MTNLERLSGEELIAMVPTVLERVRLSPRDKAPEEVMVELAKRLEEASKALDEVADQASPFCDFMYHVDAIAEPGTAIHAQIAKRKQT